MRIYLLTIVLTLSTYSHAQNWEKETELSHAILTYKDGSQIEGTAKLMDDFRILFKEGEGEENKAKIIGYEDIGELNIKLEKRHRRLVPRIIEGEKGKDSIKLLEILISGKISLFRIYRSGTAFKNPAPAAGGGFPGISFTTGYSKTNYYISRDDNQYVTHMSLANTRSPLFKSIANRYFYDCPILLKKIKSKEFERDGVETVVHFYNENCK